MGGFVIILVAQLTIIVEQVKRILFNAGEMGVTEEHSEKAFGSMQRSWNYRRDNVKGIWVNAKVCLTKKGDGRVTQTGKGFRR